VQKLTKAVLKLYQHTRAAEVAELKSFHADVIVGLRVPAELVQLEYPVVEEPKNPLGMPTFAEVGKDEVGGFSIHEEFKHLQDSVAAGLYVPEALLQGEHPLHPLEREQAATRKRQVVKLLTEHVKTGECMGVAPSKALRYFPAGMDPPLCPVRAVVEPGVVIELPNTAHHVVPWEHIERVGLMIEGSKG
jgi:hypothetical protein